ncbi:autotransporter outer membrane beta-barrel domain-containing protein [Sphingomonas sp. BK580]|uniref:autotransporter outer membrane beta-barrel domain-containing protein n=1 Tax=Sphingomonas sp. BK580 TaxID=2586972 RepID=UPI001621CBB0|nr:autotransporter outer membrane beta-barrel domain-containing protein [Sphingomonas sp. BK580]MBB3694916.1 hypothetical protein [Sphingomonas sp. BK580]
MSVGGSGGDGGAGGIVDYASGRDTTNAGSIETFGADAFGILGQSIGGGGGAGGSSIAIAETSGFRDFPTLSIAFAVGGSGGKGGRGNAVRLGNTGTIVTGGSGAIGIAGQSIGGGGGVAGDASAQASSSGKSVNLSASIAVGGRGKAAGEGGAVTIENLGDIATAGADADGLLAQSIGGGGGSGGFGDGTSESSDGKLNVALTMAIGGDGGGGGSGGPVIANNGGRISTQGAGANGITAQTVGGGGGRAGGGAGSASGDYSLSLNVGGLAGSGGGTFGTGTMRVDNTGLIETAGGDAAGILAQSIGGGGGVGGKAAGASLQSQTSIRGEPSSAINLVLAVGGKGGTGGAAGAITVTNTGELRTRGALADGIVAQAIGGGGGKGGASNPAQSAKDTGQLVVGGTGGAGGNGGQPIVLNQGAISTAGPLAAGIITQSISGGGGVGGLSASTAGVGTAASTLFNSASLSVGGSGAASGTSGQAIVENTGYIETSGHDSPGIIAQSIAGGGGIVKLMSTSLETEANSGVAKEFDANIRFGGPAATNGASGLVRVTTRSGADIRTSGDNSFGIVAQTIAGGGGLFLGGTPTVRPSKDYFGVGKMTGSVIDDMERNSGNSGLWIETGGNIITTGQGAAAILAQSIGGGGGLAGDSGATEQLLPFQASVNHDGSGGAIDIKVGPASIIATSGTNAPALILQSIGGGGGRVVTKSGVFSGTAGGTGRGGAINVLVDGKVSANGPASRGIFAQSVGDRTSSSPITIIVGSTGSISGGPLVNGSGDPTAAIYLDHGGMTVSSPNRVANRGKITSLGAARGTAIFGDYGTTIVTNSGVIVGSVNLSNNGGSGSLENTGIIEASTIRLGGGSFENAGRWIVDASRGPVILGGDYVGKATGQIVVAADLESSEPAIEVAGRAILFGGLKIEPSSLRNKSVVLINAAGGITTNSPVQIEPTKLYTFTAENTGNALVVTPHAHFQQATAGLDANEMALAEALQTMWDDGVDASSLFTALASIDETSSYEQSLAALSGGAVESVATFQFANARVFLNNLEVGCGDAGEADACSWGRIVDSDSSQTGDSGFRQRGWAMQFGTEAAIGEDWTLSSGLSYDENHFTGNQSFTQIRGSSARLGLAIGYSPSEWSFQAALASGIGRYRSLRTIAVGDVAGEADGRLTQFQLAARLSVSNDISLGVAYLRPGLSIGVLGLHTPFHREHSLQKLGLSFASDTHVVALLDPSLEMGAKISVGQEHVLRLFGNVGAQFASQSEWVSRANFAVEDGSSFRVASPVADVIARARLGFVLETRKARFSLEYAQDGGSGYRSKSLAIRAAVNF